MYNSTFWLLIFVIAGMMLIVFLSDDFSNTPTFYRR